MANVTTIATLGLGVGIAGVRLFAVNLLPALSSSTRTPCGWRCDIRWIPATTSSHPARVLGGHSPRRARLRV
jgi:hypothetical protein